MPPFPVDAQLFKPREGDRTFFLSLPVTSLHAAITFATLPKELKAQLNTAPFRDGPPGFLQRGS